MQVTIKRDGITCKNSHEDFSLSIAITTLYIAYITLDLLCLYISGH